MAEASLLGNSSHFIDRLLALLTRSPQLYMVAAARGLEDEPQESVLPLTDYEKYFCSQSPLDGRAVLELVAQFDRRRRGARLFGLFPGNPLKRIYNF